MQLSCEPVLHHALLYPVSARALQQHFPCTPRTHTLKLDLHIFTF